MLEKITPSLKMVSAIVVGVVIVHQIDYYLFGGREARMRNGGMTTNEE
tara:strand:- start:3460 stop:3603 length:144 start_codon:yes stop_codon:yes gene_type:complete